MCRETLGHDFIVFIFVQLLRFEFVSSLHLNFYFSHPTIQDVTQAGVKLGSFILLQYFLGLFFFSQSTVSTMISVIKRLGLE